MGYSFLLKNRSLMTSRTCKNISPLNTFLNFQGILKPLLITAAHPPSHGPQAPPTTVNNLEWVFSTLLYTYIDILYIYFLICSHRKRTATWKSSPTEYPALSSLCSA